MLSEVERSEIRQCYRWTKSACPPNLFGRANVIGGKKTIIIVLVGFLALVSYEACAKSRNTPKFSNKMSGKESRFSLEDPRVALNNIKEANRIKEPQEKKLPKGVAGSPYTPEEQEAIDTVEDLKKAYTENKHRPDGYGIEITREIITTLSTIQSKRSVDFLCKLLESDKEIVELKKEIVEALKQIGDKKAVDSLKKHLAYLTANKPNDPLAGQAWQDWIDATQNAINQLESK